MIPCILEQSLNVVFIKNIGALYPEHPSNNLATHQLYQYYTTPSWWGILQTRPNQFFCRKCKNHLHCLNFHLLFCFFLFPLVQSPGKPICWQYLYATAKHTHQPPTHITAQPRDTHFLQNPFQQQLESDSSQLPAQSHRLTQQPKEKLDLH